MSSVNTVATIAPESLARLSVEQYHAMIRSGILTDDDAIKLIEGWLILKMAKNPAHRATTRLVRTALEAIVPVGWYVDSQEPITLSNSEPEPDVVIVRGETRQYLDRHPGAAEIVIVIEVSDTTLQRDRQIKKRIYAQAKIPICWIINLVESQSEVYAQPAEEEDDCDYRQRQDYERSDRIPLEIEGVEIGSISVASLLP
ncbi:MAG TPA: Uma2 family endonuclease [Oscillatoriales cyanobacterium M59_W2019_021]|nr:MAG: Uma2 family endonuclease [Cyanobacteria bacterium J055]HIK31426.1 Uma2 family endonuclease [Oscillatoriales cyanobacterium M4454_W2019_049]HIK52658.1 Uma2 family endonuclease [Oscillatoriales cyanobacterium M59_W2019_021]